MIFNIFINFFEDLILNCFLAKYFSIKKKCEFILLATLVSGLATTLLDKSSTVNEYLLLGLIFLIELIMLRFFEEKTNYKQILGVLLGLFLIIFSNFISLVISSFIFHIQIFDVASNYKVFIYTIILSKIILMILSFITVKIFLKNEVELQLKQWWTLVLIEVIIIISLFSLVYGMIYTLSNPLIIMIMILLSIVAFLSMELSYKIHKEEQIKMRYMLESQKNMMKQDTYEKLQRLKYEVGDMEHKFMYILLQIKNQTKDEEIINISNNYIKNLSKFSSLFVSDNPYFDTIICSKLNELWLSGRNSKISIFISKSSFYDQLDFVKLLLNLIDLFHSSSVYSSDIEISINEKNQFVIIKLISQFVDGKDLFLSKQLYKDIEKFNGKVRVAKYDEYSSVIISIDRGDLESHV